MLMRARTFCKSARSRIISFKWIMSRCCSLPTQSGSSFQSTVVLPFTIFRSQIDFPTLFIRMIDPSRWLNSLQSIVLSSPVAIISSVSGPAKRFYCATCFHPVFSRRASTRGICVFPRQCISFLSSYTFSLFFCPRIRYFLPNQDFYRAGINPCCRLRLILQLSLIQRIPCGTLLLLPSI